MLLSNISVNFSEENFFSGQVSKNSADIGLKSVEFVVGSDSIVTLTHSLRRTA